MERLASVLKNLKDDERQSKLRNEHLLRDFEKVSKLSVDLDTKARKLKRVKVVYLTVISFALISQRLWDSIYFFSVLFNLWD